MFQNSEVLFDVLKIQDNMDLIQEQESKIQDNIDLNQEQESEIQELRRTNTKQQKMIKELQSFYMQGKAKLF